MLFSSSAAETFPLEAQEAEENFDLALIASLEIDVAPYLGDSRVPDYLVSQLAQILHRGSVLYESDLEPISTSTSPTKAQNSVKVEKVDLDQQYDLGSTEFGSLVPRERFSYWCFDLLFLICSNTTHGECIALHVALCLSPVILDQENARRRLATLSMSSLLNRCRSAMVGYVADEALRGNLPFPR